MQNEGLAHEVAARFYAARGFDTFARAYLREARRCYLRWGASGKVRQLEQLHPHLRDAPVPASPTATIGAPVGQLDVGTVLKAAQAVSGEIVLGELIKTLLRIVVEHAGAGRGVLILCQGDEPQIAAEATTGRGQVEVALRQAAVSPAEASASRGLIELSVGDYVLSGGELGAMVILDACVRLLPGVMGAASSGEDESFEAGLLEYPHYTRPQEWEGRTIPEVLRSGDHAKIAAWRHERAVEDTRLRRPDLIERHGGASQAPPSGARRRDTKA